MPITRRSLLAGLAAVAGTAGANAYAAEPGAAALSEREAFFVGEHRWAVGALLRALDTEDFAAWIGGGHEHECPSRWRLARCLVMLRELKDRSPLERTIKAEISKLWVGLTRPQWRVPRIRGA
jgi:hypothetical protein